MVPADDATSHTAHVSITALRKLFQTVTNPKVGNIVWSDRPLDLSICNFFVWNLLKCNVCVEGLQTTTATKIKNSQSCSHYTSCIMVIIGNVLLRIQECIDNNGAHQSRVIFKN